MGSEERKENILLVDDHPFVREGMSKTIAKDGRYFVCDEVGSVAEAIASLKRFCPDYAIVDISLGDGSGLDVLEFIQKQCPECLPIVVSMYEEPIYIEKALQAGAKGYVFKRESVQSILQALQHVRLGHIYMSQHVVQILVERKVAQKGPEVREVLSEREFEIFRLLGKGHRRNKIADILFISTRTVDTHLERIKSKLHCQDTAQLMRTAVEYNLANSTKEVKD